MELRVVLYILSLIVGVKLVGWGWIGFSNRRPVNGMLLLSIGLLCIGFSVYHIAIKLDVVNPDSRLAEAQRAQKEVERRYDKTLKSRQFFTDQLQDEYTHLASYGLTPDQITNQFHTDAKLASHIERIALLHRWIEQCDQQLQYDTEALQSYRNLIFYYRNLHVFQNLEWESSGTFAVENQIEEVVEQAKSDQRDARVLDVSNTELEAIVEALRNQMNTEAVKGGR